MSEAASGLESLASRIRGARPASELLTVVSGDGVFSAAQARSTITAWTGAQPGLDFAVWEFFSKLMPPRPCRAIPESLEYLERARLFGSGGDLELRRDENRLLWRFVGPKEAGLPDLEGSRHWPGDDQKLVCRERTALLWGRKEKGGNEWYEPRVGAADLSYEAAPESGRMVLHFREYSWAGSVHFVWWTAVEGGSEPEGETPHSEAD